jgi:hypothetical protein
MNIDGSFTIAGKELGTIAPGATVEFDMELPAGLKLGHEVMLQFGWTCGGCNTNNQKTFKFLVGENPHFDFACDTCGPMTRFQKFMRRWWPWSR